MKKITFLLVCLVMVTGIVFAGDDGNISVKDDGEYVVISIKNVRFSPVGKNVSPSEWTTSKQVDIYSGVLDAANIKESLAEVKVVNGGVEFKFLNSAKVSGVPVVDHLWGFSQDRKMALIFDPSDLWVCSKYKDDGKPDLNTLAIGIIMYPDKPTKPLKPYGKLPQGKHPKLAKE